jgi:hypothetical protein
MRGSRREKAGVTLGNKREELEDERRIRQREGREENNNWGRMCGRGKWE